MAIYDLFIIVSTEARSATVSVVHLVHDFHLVKVKILFLGTGRRGEQGGATRIGVEQHTIRPGSYLALQFIPKGV